MTRVKILALLAGMVLLFTLTATVYAQRLPPHVFVGTAWIDDAAVAEGTTITAWVAGAEAASTSTTGAGGDYVITVDQGDSSFTGETISFQIAGLDAAQTATWTQGGADLLTLSASSARVAGEVVSITLDERNDSGQSGTATLTEFGSTFDVVLSLSAGTSQTELVRIHSGQCGDTLGGVVHSLTSFVGGSGDSTTTVSATLASVQDGDHAVNSHDASDASIYTACGNIPSLVTAPESTEVPAVTVQGEQGPRGLAGATGNPGAEGPEGPEGSKGNAGATGPQGDAGAAGAQGATGSAGSQGATGDAGGQGQSGPAGLQGDDGSNVLGIIALILAIIGIVGAGGAFLLSRRS